MEAARRPAPLPERDEAQAIRERWRERRAREVEQMERAERLRMQMFGPTGQPPCPACAFTGWHTTQGDWMECKRCGHEWRGRAAQPWECSICRTPVRMIGDHDADEAAIREHKRGCSGPQTPRRVRQLLGETD